MGHCFSNNQKEKHFIEKNEDGNGQLGWPDRRWSKQLFSFNLVKIGLQAGSFDLNFEVWQP